jgi:hypothetical protein
VHADNTLANTPRVSINFFNNNPIQTTLHPLYSPDIAPPDFHLFSYVKGCLAGRPFINVEEFFEAVRGVLDTIKKMTL